MSRREAMRIPGARSLRPRLQVVNAWRWDGTPADAALMGQWLIALGVAGDLEAHYRNTYSSSRGTLAFVKIRLDGHEQDMAPGEWLLWLGGTAFMVLNDETRAIMFATDDEAPIVVAVTHY